MCIQQTAPDGFYRNQDCRQFSNFVCELNLNAEFSEPPAGKVWFVLCCDYDYDYTIIQKVISTLPTTQMIIQTTMSR